MKLRKGHARKGDTLIEVAIATGIFSLVAITVVAVVNGSTSSAQSNLEITIAREEIDAQAEALRFIHNSYLTGDDTGTSTSLGTNTTYNKLWQKIIGLARNNATALNFQPKTCDELYANDAAYLKQNGAFILNTRQLSSTNINNIIYTAQTNTSQFKVASTYPRIIHVASDSGTNSLLNQGSGTGFYRAEGIFIIPIKDQKSTNVVTAGGVVKKAAYYDFYIRTCWFGPGADRPSTISTVVRLYDPNVIDF